MLLRMALAQITFIPTPGAGLLAPRPPFPMPGLPPRAGPTMPASVLPIPGPFLPASTASTPPIWHAAPSGQMCMVLPTIPAPTSTVMGASEPALPAAEPAQSDDSTADAPSGPSSPCTAPAHTISPRLPAAMIIITPPHPEGLARLQQQRDRDGSPTAPVDKPRGPSVVTPMPSAEELARLRAVIDRRRIMKELVVECGSPDQRLTPSVGRQKSAASPAPVRCFLLSVVHELPSGEFVSAAGPIWP